MENSGKTAVDTSFRNMSMASLTALRLSALQAIEAVVGEGQSYSLNGRQVTHAGLEKYVRILANCDAAIAFKNSVDAQHGSGSISRYADFSHQ